MTAVSILGSCRHSCSAALADTYHLCNASGPCPSCQIMPCKNGRMRYRETSPSSMLIGCLRAGRSWTPPAFTDRKAFQQMMRPSSGDSTRSSSWRQDGSSRCKSEDLFEAAAQWSLMAERDYDPAAFTCAEATWGWRRQPHCVIATTRPCHIYGTTAL